MVTYVRAMGNSRGIVKRLGVEATDAAKIPYINILHLYIIFIINIRKENINVTARLQTIQNNSWVS